jgi:hypothetical protein
MYFQHRRVVQPHLVLPFIDSAAVYHSGSGFHLLSFAGQTVLKAIAAYAPGAVSAHLAQRAVGVKKQHAVVAAVFRAHNSHQAVGAHGQPAGAHSAGNIRQPFSRYVLFRDIYDNEVVSGSLHFGEFHRRLRKTVFSIMPPRAEYCNNSLPHNLLQSD